MWCLPPPGLALSHGAVAFSQVSHGHNLAPFRTPLWQPALQPSRIQPMFVQGGDRLMGMNAIGPAATGNDISTDGKVRHQAVQIPQSDIRCARGCGCAATALRMGAGAWGCCDHGHLGVWPESGWTNSHSPEQHDGDPVGYIRRDACLAKQLRTGNHREQRTPVSLSAGRRYRHRFAFLQVSPRIQLVQMKPKSPVISAADIDQFGPLRLNNVPRDAAHIEEIREWVQ